MQDGGCYFGVLGQLQCKADSSAAVGTTEERYEDVMAAVGIWHRLVLAVPSQTDFACRTAQGGGAVAQSSTEAFVDEYCCVASRGL